LQSMKPLLLLQAASALTGVHAMLNSFAGLLSGTSKNREEGLHNLDTAATRECVATYHRSSAPVLIAIQAQSFWVGGTF
jgi:hypothetical protein